MFASRMLLLMIVAVAAISVSMPPRAQAVGSRDPAMTNMMRAERHAHLGQNLPAGIEVTLDDGSRVDLLEHLHGPLILIKIDLQGDLSGLFAAIRNARGKSLGDRKAHIAIVTIDDGKHDPLPVPDSVMTFHDTSMMDDGFLGGRLLPTTFYFDADMKLVKRQPGLPASPMELLYFPAP